MQTAYDVVVLGAGPAGLATARALRQQVDVSVLVVDAGKADRDRVGESVPPDVLVPLEQLGLGEVFRSADHKPCPGNASVWGRPQVGYNDFIYNPMGPAWRLNRRSFDSMLVNAALESGADIRWQTRFHQTRRLAGGGYELKLTAVSEPKHSNWVSAACVVDATGPKASFARAIGIKKQVSDKLFAQACFSDVTKGEMSLQTLLEATEDGWWYAALLPDQRLITMFVTDLAELRKIKTPSAWSVALQQTTFIGPVIQKMQLSNQQMHSLPVYSSLLESVQGDDWLAVGDAASSYDPIAAQGLYKALINGVAAGQMIASRLSGNARTTTDTIGNYQQNISNAYLDYSKNRQYLYKLEQRWGRSLFWQNRWQASVVLDK